MAVLAMIFLGYVLVGAYLPDVIAHKGASIPRTISHMWLVTEGVLRHRTRRVGVVHLRVRACSARCSTAPAAATT